VEQDERVSLIRWAHEKMGFHKALQVLAFSNVKGKDLTLIPAVR
jgi:hypothetical protein